MHYYNCKHHYVLAIILYLQMAVTPKYLLKTISGGTRTARVMSPCLTCGPLHDKSLLFNSPSIVMDFYGTLFFYHDVPFHEILYCTCNRAYIMDKVDGSSISSSHHGAHYSV